MGFRLFYLAFCIKCSTFVSRIIKNQKQPVMSNKKLFLSAILAFGASCGFAQVETPTMGWSSWNTFAVNISEDIIKGQADAMVEKGLDAVGYQYINIDDGFQYGRLDDGNVRIHPQRFPNGLKPVSDYIHSKGLKVGIYSDAGDCTCGSIGNGEVWNTNVGFLGHEDQDCHFYFNECEFDFIKVDYCGGNHAGLNEKEQYTKIGNAIKNTGRDVRYNLCRWAYPGNWAHDISTSWRTTGDIYDGWESVKGILNENLYLSAYCYGGCYNDMDMLEVGRSMTEEEDKTHFGMWCIMSSPLLIGCNMANLEGKALELLKNEELIALNQDPLGIQAYVAKKVGDTYILVKDVNTLYGKTRAVALYNPSDKDEVMTLSFDDVDLGGQVAVRDLFEHQDLGAMTGAMSVTVPAHGTRIYRLDAETRLERYNYEAETAFLNTYQELYNNEAYETAIYIGTSNASGKVYAGWLGNRAENFLQWGNVYSIEGGEYTLTFCCGTQETRKFDVEVNGQMVSTVSVNTGGWETFQDFTLTVNLNPGENIIKLYNSSAWMPNIDCMTIEKTGSNTIIDRRLESACATLKAKAEAHTLTNALQAEIASLLAEASATDLTTAQKETLLAKVEGMIDTVGKILELCEEYDLWKTNAEKNIAVSVESNALTTLLEKMESAEQTFQEAATTNTANRVLTSLKTALRAYFRNDNALPREGEQLDMTLLLTNYDFSTTGGWMGEPDYRSGTGQEYNKTFDMYQNLSTMRPGRYTVRCNALYRTTHNDGGEAYRNGTEQIPAVFYVNEQTETVPSIYSYNWEDASRYGHVDNLNGYVHSMYAAGIVFAQGAYQNEIVYEQKSKGAMKIGLKCDQKKDGCWCCFDNFSISFEPLTNPSAINEVKTEVPYKGIAYDLQGRKVSKNSTKGIQIIDGKKVLK